MSAIRVAVAASDALAAEGASAWLRAHGAQVVARGAEVGLLMVEELDQVALAVLERLRGAGQPRPIPVVVVTRRVRRESLLRAVEVGLCSLLDRDRAGFEQVLSALTGAVDGRATMPERVLAGLLAEFRRLQQELVAVRGLTGTGFEPREVEVLRLLADGLDTAEIAERLQYSERTIKTVIQGLLSRLQLRNRSHAVAVALRAGVL